MIIEHKAKAKEERTFYLWTLRVNKDSNWFKDHRYTDDNGYDTLGRPFSYYDGNNRSSDWKKIDKVKHDDEAIRLTDYEERKED